MAWLDGWTYRKQITIDNTNVDGNLTDFPLLVAFDDDPEVGANSLSTGYDIRFTEADGTTLLKYEKEQWYSPYENVVFGIGTPTHYWRMDDLSGTQLTDIAGKYHGLLANAPTLDQTGAMPSFDGNPSIEFNGAGQYATFGSDVVWDSSGAMSVSWWQTLDDYSGTAFPQIFSFKSDQAQVFKCFCSTQSGYDGVNFGANSGFGTWRSTGDISSDLLSGWHHIVITFDGVDRTASGSYTLYVDGSVVAHVAASGFLGNASTTYIARNISTNGYWDGKLDEIVVWEQELSQANVTALYDIGVTNPATSTANIWVKSDITSATPTNLYMYYGNSGASDGEDATNVWDANFDMVQHMVDTTTSSITGSTSNGYVGTKDGANGPAEIDGKVYKGQDFDGLTSNADQITISGPTLNTSLPFTVSAWVYLNGYTTNSYPGIGIFASNSTGWQWLLSDQAGFLGFTFGSGSAGWISRTTNSASLAGAWHYLTITYNGSGATNGANFLAYIDSVSTAHINANPFGASPNNTKISVDANQQNWDGIIDEYRLSSSVRSAEWTKFDYNNIENGETTIKGQEEENPTIANYGGIYLL